MAENPAYTVVPGKIEVLLTKIRETGVPARASNSWLGSIGLKSSNDRSLIPVLRQIGFIDSGGVPTPAWKSFRGASHKAVLGRAIQVGYSDLYQTYPDAHTRSNPEIADVFTTKSTAAKSLVDRMVSTFKALVALAEFADTPNTSGDFVDSSLVAPIDHHASSTIAAQTRMLGGVGVNINIALTLPETSDEKVFAAFFKAMREHLITADES